MLLAAGGVVGLLARAIPASKFAGLTAALTPYAGFGLTIAFC
jgi:hypothetical protein